jgi:large repetitive protein
LAGYQATDTRTITLDQTAPALTITQPADNSVGSTASLKITGSVDDALAVVINASANNGQTANAHMVGSNFDVTVNLVPGMNTIEITATDQAGNISSVKRSVIADSAAPTLAVTDPAQDISTTQGSISISGTVTNAITSAAISIAADGKTYAPTIAIDGSFSQTISLPTDKTYAIIVTATDQAGNTATVQRNIIKTTTPYPTGDINGDGKVDISDALKALRIAVGLESGTTDDLLRGDVAPLQNGVPAPDGVIDIADAVVILRKVVGLINW